MTTQHAAFHNLRVAAIEELTEDSVAITFEVPDELRSDYAFAHGQHLNIRGGDDVRRSYSICTPPSSGVLRIGVKRLPGGAFSEDGKARSIFLRFPYPQETTLRRTISGRCHLGD